MKNKKIICILIFGIINVLCLNIPYSIGADVPKYLFIYTDESFPDSISFEKDEVENNENEDEIKKIANKIMKVNIDKCLGEELCKFNQVLEDFYTSYQNLSEADKTSYYNKLYEFSVEGTKEECYNQLKEKSSLSVAEEIFKRAYHMLHENNPNTGKGYSYGEVGAKSDVYLGLSKVIENRMDEVVGEKGITPPSSSAVGQGGDNGQKTDEQEEEEKKKAQVIYENPYKISKAEQEGAGDDIEEAISQGKEFIQVGQAKDIDLVSFSNAYYNIALAIGIAITVIVGMVLGIKFMSSSTERKAEIKELLLPYVVGCVVIYGSFGIWKLVVTIVGSI